LDRWQIDIIEDITRTEVHYWRRNEEGGLDLYAEEVKEFRAITTGGVFKKIIS
jgi:hypothetical protein